MIRQLAILANCFVALVATACAPAQPRVVLTAAQAENLCTQRARQYAETPLMVPDENGTIQIGLQAETPDDFLIKSFYKSCYRANTGVYPDNIPKIPSYS